MDNHLSSLAICSININDYLINHKIDGITQVYVFEQVWGSTALGFGGWGGQTLTNAWTHVVATYEGKYIVFFNGRYAYTVESSTEEFVEDLEKQYMPSVSEAFKRYNK